MENITKKDIEEIIQRTTGVLLEDLSAKFDTFGESLDYIRQKIGNLEQRVARIEEEIVNIKIDIVSIKNELAEIKEKLSEKVDRHEYLELEKRVDKLENYIKRHVASKNLATT